MLDVLPVMTVEVTSVVRSPFTLLDSDAACLFENRLPVAWVRSLRRKAR